MKPQLSAEFVRHILSYDPQTGIFRWRHRATYSPGWNTRWVDREAGFIVRGHVVIQIDGANYYAHRLAWLYMTGQEPSNQVDHQNRDRGDNRWKNLRLADHSDNCCNKSMQRNNTSGASGVVYVPATNKWRARINKNRKRVFDRCFDSMDEAIAARQAALPKIHGAFAVS